MGRRECIYVLEKRNFHNSKHEDVAKRLDYVWIINVGLLAVEHYVLIFRVINL